MASTEPRKPEGGFQFISVILLCLVWLAYHNKRIRLYDVRVWCAAVELVARRCKLKPEQRPTYTYNELAQIVAGGGGISTSLHRLQGCGLLTWESYRITFPDHLEFERQPADVQAMLQNISNHKRLVPVPRRLLRFIAKGCSCVLLATILGHLFRCLYYRHGQCQPEGFCKASWIAQVFGVSERAVKTARHRLEALGFLQRTDTPQWVRNRYGQKMTLNLQWERITPPAPSPPQPASETAPPASPLPTKIAPPDSDRKLLTEEKHQEPACDGQTGVLSTLFAQARECLRMGTTLPLDPEPTVLHHVAAPAQEKRRTTAALALGLTKAPTLHHIILQDLKETSRLLNLYAQSVQTKLIGPSEADRLTFIALAQHVLCYGPENPGGLFLRLLYQRRFHFITQDEEDTARRRLTDYLYRGSGCSVLTAAA